MRGYMRGLTVGQQVKWSDITYLVMHVDCSGRAMLYNGNPPRGKRANKTVDRRTAIRSAIAFIRDTRDY